MTLTRCRGWARRLRRLTRNGFHRHVDVCDWPGPGEQRSVAGLKVPLIDLVQRHQTIIAMLLHLSKEGRRLAAGSRASPGR